MGKTKELQLNFSLRTLLQRRHFSMMHSSLCWKRYQIPPSSTKRTSLQWYLYYTRYWFKKAKKRQEKIREVKKSTRANFENSTRQRKRKSNVHFQTPTNNHQKSCNLACSQFCGKQKNLYTWGLKWLGQMISAGVTKTLSTITMLTLWGSC